MLGGILYLGPDGTYQGLAYQRPKVHWEYRRDKAFIVTDPDTNLDRVQYMTEVCTDSLLPATEFADDCTSLSYRAIQDLHLCVEDAGGNSVQADLVRCRRAPTDVITAMCSTTNPHRYGMPPTIEAAVLTAVVLVSDTGYIGLLVDTDQSKPANDHQALEPVITFYTTGAPPIHELQHRLLDECDLSLDSPYATRTRPGGYGHCISTMDRPR
jgi:hypothetical protein